MEATTSIFPVGNVTIDGEEYTFIRTEHARAIEKKLISEPPHSDGAPNIASEPQLTWHLGGLKSRQGIPGTSEFGQNTETRFPFELGPGPALDSFITPLQDTDVPTSYDDALGYIWCTAGRRVYRINPADNSITMSKDFGAGVNAIMCLEWEDGYLYVTTDAADQSLWRCTAVGSPDTWAQAGAGVTAYRITATHDTLFRVSRTGVCRKVSTGLNPLVEANWADNVQMGNTVDRANGMVTLGKSIIVGKRDGVFGVDENGFGASLIKRMSKSDDNGKGMLSFEPWTFISYGRGQYRYSPGDVQSTGLELEMLNDSEVRGIITAMASDGQWLYGVLPVGSDVYIMVAREVRGNEPGFGPLIWDTWAYLEAATCQAIHFSTEGNPQLIFAGDQTVYHIEMDTGLSKPLAFAESGVRYSTIFDFGETNPKDFPKFDVAGKNLTADRRWAFAYSVDNEDFLTTDINGDTMVLTSDTHMTFFLPTSAKGRTIQYRFTYTDESADGTVPGKIIHFEPYCIPQSTKTPVYTVQLHLAFNLMRDRGRETRTAEAQLAALEALAETAGSVVTSGPWGESVNMTVRDVSMVEMIQKGSAEPEYLVRVQLQEREAV